MPDTIAQPPSSKTARHNQDRDARTQRIVAAARKTFGDERKAARWLERPTTALGGMSPIALLVSDDGAKQVEDLLRRIDHGLAV